MAIPTVPENRLLAALPAGEFRTLSPLLERVELVYKKVLYQANDKIRHVYFPESGIISLLSVVDAHNSTEVGIVGNEGMAGLPLFMLVSTSSTLALVQGAGLALRMKAADFKKYAAESASLRAVLLRYMHSLFTQISQSAACNQFHSIDKRLARWLLMTQDRMHSREFQITQDFLSSMLGVRREGVNIAAGALQEKGLICYVRGSMKIKNRKQLERAACSCYKVIKKEYDWKLK